MGSRGGSSKTRVSDYYLAAHFGVCHGPVDAVLEVIVGEKTAWSGSSAPADGSPVDGHDVLIRNEGLFGGNKKEGGVAGTMTVMHGASTQLVPSKIAEFIGLPRDKVPGYRGILSLFFHSAEDRKGFEGLNGFEVRNGFKWASNNPYLKPLWVKLRARPGTWYPEKAMINGDANPMHIIRECLVNTDWGMGAASKSLDDAQMRQIADTLYSEQFGLSLMWAQQTEIEKFIGEILRHINGAMCINPRTGKFHFKLIREDYTQASLPAFNRNQGTIRTSQRKAWDETVNEINVSWTNPLSEEKEVVTVHDPANITIQGAIVPDSRDMYGIRNIDLATKVAMREIQIASKPLMLVEVDFDRSAFGLLPGDAIKLVDWKELDFAEIVMRVVTIDYGTPDSMVIRASLVEDVFGQPAVYTAQEPNRWQSTSEDPKPIVSWEVMTAPYFIVARLLGETRAQSLTYPAVYPVVLAAPEGKDTNTYVQQAQRGNIAGTGPVWQNSYDRVPVGFATLVNTLPIGVTGEVTLTGLKGRVYAEVGNYLFIGGQNGEICLITDTSSGAIVVRRGCLDTSPRQWPAGTPVWITDDNRHGFDEELSAYGATQNYRLLPTTSKGQLQVSLAPVISGTMSDRPFRPYPPANVRVNGDLFPSAKQLPLAFSWSERNRILETSVILPWDSGSVPSEPGTSYTLEVDAFVGGTWQVNAVAVRNAVITSFEVKADILPSNTTAIRFRLWATNGGLRSWTNVEHTFAIGDSGTGLPPGAGVEFGPPPAPVSVLVNARRNSIVLTPQFAALDTFTCEFWRSRVPLREAEIESDAFKAGQGVFIEDTGLAIDTAYFYFIRAVNTYGKSSWYSMEARTKIDPQQVLDEMDGLIDSSKLTPELQEDLGKLPALEIEVGKIPAIEQAVGKIPAIELEVGKIPAIELEIDKIPAIELEIDKIPAIELGIDKIPAIELEIDKIPAIEQEIDKIPAIELEVGKIPAIEQEVGKIPAIELGVGKIPAIEQSIDLVDTKAEHAALGVLSLAAAQTKSEERRLVSEASIKDSQVVLADEQQALASRIETLDAEFATGLSEANAAIQNESTVRATADAVQAQQISALDTKFTTGLSDASAAVQNEATARSTADAAQVQATKALDTKFTTDIASANAAIQNEATARSTADAAQVQATKALDTKFTADIASANAAIQNEATARSSADAAQVQATQALDTKFTTDIASANAAIQNEAAARSTADAAQVQATQALDTKFTTDIASANAAIKNEATARSTADAAQVQATQALDTKFTNGLSDANAAIKNEATARSTADAAQVQATQALDTKFTNGLSDANAAIQSEAAARSTADAAQVKQISALDTKFTTDIASANAAIQQEAAARTSADAAQVQTTQALDTKFTNGLSDANAAIQQEAAARSTADAAQVQQISALDTKFTNGLSDASAAIQNEAAARTSADSAQASVSEGLKAELVKSGEAALSNAVKDFEGEQRQRTVSAEIKEDLNVVVNDQVAMAERIETLTSNFESDIAAAKASVSELARVTSTADSALAQQVSALDTKFTTDIASANAAIQNEATARSTADAAQVQATKALDTKFTADIASANAAIQSEATARSTADAAQVQATQALDTKFTADIASANAAIQSEATARSTADAAQVKQISALDTKFTTDIASANAAIQSEATARSTADAAQVKQISALDTKFTADIASANAAIKNEATARSTADAAQVKQISALDTKFTADIASANAAIKNEATARSTADAAQVQATQALDTKFTADIASANAAIQNEATARSTADAAQVQATQALDTKFTTDIASANAAIQSEATARSTADAAQVQATKALDTKFTTDIASANAAIQQEALTRADADSAQAQLINSLDTKFTTDIGETNAAIQQEAIARSTADAAQVSVSEGLKAELVKSGEASLSNAIKDFEGEIRQLKSSAEIKTDINVVVDDQKALAQRIETVQTSFETGLSAAESSIVQEAKTRASADSAQAQLINALDSKFTTDISETNAAIQQEASTRADADSAQAQQISALDTKFTTDIASANAAIQEEAVARADADSAQVQATQALDTKFTTDIASANAAIQNEATARSSADAAQAQQISALDTKFTADIASANAAIQNEATARSSADAAQAQQISALGTKFTADIASANAAIQNEATARSTADAAQVQATQALDTKFTTDIASANAAIQNEAAARSTADAAQAQQISALDTKFTTDIASANAAIQNEAAARSTADAAQVSVSEGLKAELVKSGEASLSNAIKDFEGEVRQLTSSAEIKTDLNVVVDEQKALAQRIETVQASFETGLSEAEASIVQEALTRADADSAQAQLINSLDTKFTTDIASANAAIQSEATARSTADSALSQSISTVQSSLNGTMATVQQNSEAIVDLEGGAQAMWSVKAQAGDITAGIGLIADQATGKSQVMVNASQFFVFDNAVGKTAIFAIDQGQVIIRDAVIRKATIDILNATEITATNVKAGTGAFGRGGSYMAFNETWHTLISSNGDLKTDRLYAEGGWLRNMTVEENCDVKGTIYANKIEGDVMRVWSIDAAGVSSSAERLVSTFDLTPYARGRRITPIGTLTWFAVKITTQTGYVVKNYDSYRLESDVPAGTSRLYAYLRNTGYTGAVLIYL